MGVNGWFLTTQTTKPEKKGRKIEMQLGASSYCTFWHITLQSGLPVY